MLTPREADELLAEGYERNPGRWRDHCRSAAVNARLIAAQVPGMDPDRAYVLALLHDIGRRAGPGRDMLHIFDGYDYLTALGQPDIARACLTHSFPVKSTDMYSGRYDVSPAQLAFLEGYLAGIEYDEYDRLVQLCDAISLPGGACIMEKRLLDVSLRYGLPENTIPRWRAFLALKKRFDGLCGRCVYELLPDVLENSYTDLI